MSVVLSEHLPLLASAPDGIQKLRDLILELAVRGKLVPQDPEDEPASELLKRIAKERARLEGEGICKTSKATALGAQDAPPFELPSGWALSQLSDLTLVLNGRAYSKNELLSEGVPVLRVGKLFTSNHWYYSNLQLEDDKYCDQGDLLYSWSASFGPFIWQGPKVIYHYHIWKLRLFDESNLCKEFFYKFLLEKTAEIKAASHGVSMIHMTKEKMEKILVPVPPLAEQHRIVAKVDELMALCDRLEAEQAGAESAHARLVETLLGTLTQSADAGELAGNWQRLAEHFETLFATESSLDALKKTILQLAVKGKLVPQDPNDEPATELLRRIQTMRRYRRKVVDVDFEELEIPEPKLPCGWTWTVVDQVAADNVNSITDGPFGANLKTEHYVSVSGYRVIRLQNIGKDEFRGEHHAYITEERFLALSKHQILAGDLVVAGLVDDDQGIRCCLLPEDIGLAVVKADCYRFSVHPDVAVRFAEFFLNSPLSSDFASSHHHGMTLTRIGLGNFRRLPFPLPPLAEQHRIVAKVDELMALCNHIKADLAESRTRQTRLSVTLIESALQAT